MITAMLVLAGLAILFGLLLGFASRYFRVESDPLVDKIDQLLCYIFLNVSKFWIKLNNGNSHLTT
jgi:hypothetical protein